MAIVSANGLMSAWQWYGKIACENVLAISMATGIDHDIVLYLYKCHGLYMNSDEKKVEKVFLSQYYIHSIREYSSGVYCRVGLDI